MLVSVRNVTSDFFNTAGMEIIEGRGFSKNPAQDSTNIIVTESFAKLMGSGSAIGKTVKEDYPVIGVVKDYLYDDMYGSSDPVISSIAANAEAVATPDFAFTYIKRASLGSLKKMTGSLDPYISSYK